MKRSRRSPPRPAKSQAKLKTPKIQSQMMLKDPSINNDQQITTHVLKFTEPRPKLTTSLSVCCRWSTQHPKEAWRCQNCILLTSHQPTRKHSTETHTDQYTGEVLPTSQIQAGMHCTMILHTVNPEVHQEVDQQCLPSRKSLCWSCLFKAQPAVDSKVYRAHQHFMEAYCFNLDNDVDEIIITADFQTPVATEQSFGSQATYQWLPHERDSKKHCTQPQASAGTLEFGTNKHFLVIRLARCSIKWREYTRWNSHPLLMVTTNASRGSSQ